MFSFDRFNLSRFSLGSQDNTIHIELLLTESLESVAGVAIPVETTAFFNDILRGTARGAIGIASAFESYAAMNSAALMQANMRPLYGLVRMSIPRIRMRSTITRTAFAFQVILTTSRFLGIAIISRFPRMSTTSHLASTSMAARNSSTSTLTARKRRRSSRLTPNST